MIYGWPGRLKKAPGMLRRFPHFPTKKDKVKKQGSKIYDRQIKFTNVIPYGKEKLPFRLP
jgi:hypothetical protein